MEPQEHSTTQYKDLYEALESKLPGTSVTRIQLRAKNKRTPGVYDDQALKNYLGYLRSFEIDELFHTLGIYFEGGHHAFIDVNLYDVQVF